MSKKVTIELSDGEPVRVDEDEWPIVAKGASFVGQYSSQAFDGAWVKVRQHADKGAIVYGYAGDWDGGGRPTRANISAGYLVSPHGNIASAIRDVVRDLERTESVGSCPATAGRECLQNMPPRDL